MRNFLVLAATVGVAAQPPPISGHLRWSASSLRAQRNGQGVITNSRVSSWSDTSSANALVQADTNLQPTIVEGASFCHSSVQFGFGGLGGGTNMAMATDRDDLEPSGTGFTVFALTKLDALGSGAIVSKGPVGPTAGNNWWAMMSTVNSQDQLFWLNTGPPVTGASLRQVWTDTNRWVVWSYRSSTVNATLGTRILSASRDDSAAGFVNGNYLSAITNAWTGVVNNTDGFRVGAASGFVYRGQLMDVTIFPRDLSDGERTSMFQWYDSFYHLTCPALNSENATNGEPGKNACAAPAARHWAECRQTCTSGWTGTYGSTEHQCVAGEWTNSPLVCERVCPTLAAPVNFGTCRRTLMELQDSTSLRGQTVALFTNKWAVRPAVPRALRSTYWNVVDANTLFTGEPAGTKGWIYTALAAGAGCSRAVPSFLIIDRPIWQTAISFNMLVSVQLEIRFIQGIVGVVARWLDENNHIRIMFDQGTNLVSIVQVVNGIATGVSNVTYAPIGATYSQAYTVFGVLRVDLQGASIRIFDDTPGFGGGVNVLNGTVTALRSGTFGLGSAGTAAIRRFALRSDCDGAGSCLNAAPGTTCSYQCGAGFREVSGSRDYTCGSDGAWTTSNLICSINPPTISSAPKAVRENALDLATVGLPVDARSDARGAVLRFNVTRTLGSSGAVSNLFGINECSGQLFVAPGAVIDYEASNLYTDSVGRYYEAEVQAIPNQDINAAAFQNVKVYVSDVNEAARFAAEVITATIPENAAVGTAVVAQSAPAYTATDPDTLNATFRNNRYVLEVDAFPDRTFVVDPGTGLVTLNRSNVIDFETQPDMDLRIRVEDVQDGDLLNAYTLRVLITNVNEPPIMESPTLIEVDETLSLGGSPLPRPVTGRDPENDAITYSIDTAVTANNNNREPTNVAAGPLFSINSASGELTWLRTISFLPTDPTKVVDGRLVREMYTVYVAASDGSLSTTAMVKVYLMFNSTDSALPTIASYAVQTPCVGTPTCVPELPSARGQQTFTLTGTNFVATPAYSRVVVNLTEYDQNDVAVRPGYTFRTCTIVSTTTVRCQSPPGVGTNLRVEAFFFTAAGLRVPASYSTNLVWNYEAPMYDRIDNATGYNSGWPDPSLHLLSTSTGGRFYASGKGFGLDPSRIIATFGKATTTWPNVVVKDWWRARVIATNGTYLTLEAPVGGFGSNLYLKLDVGGQTFISNDWTKTFGYRPPTITAIALPSWQTGSIFDVPTDANGGILVRGIDMPPAQYEADGVTWNSPQVDGYYGTITQYPNGCSWDSLINGCYKTDPCYNDWGSPPYTTFFCWLPFAGSVGANLTVTLVIRDHEGDGYITTRTSVLTGNPGTFGHRAPVLNPTGVSGLGSRNADTAGGQTLTIAGFNLGPLGLSQETWGTIGIRLVYGNRLTAPWDPRAPQTRYQYQARNCRVVFADAWAPAIPGPNGRVECDTDEGTGIGHAMRIAIGGQWSNEITNVLSYGAPIISAFVGQAALAALTSGQEPIIVQGRNFGRWIDRVNVSYVQLLDQDKLVGIPTFQVTQPILPIGTPLRFVPANCTFSQNHTALLCFTAPGAGGNLKWFATVDGQLSRDPFSSYGVAQVFNITAGNFAGEAGARPANALSPEAPELLYVVGQNFGPGWSQVTAGQSVFMQWCRYVNSGTQTYLTAWRSPTGIIAGEFHVVSHSRMLFQPRPGYGQNLFLEMMVADQESGRTQATFSYVQPRLLFITPQNGTTKSDVPNQYRINLFASDLPFTDLTVEYYMNIGNGADGSRVNRVICTRNARVFTGNVQSISCPVPSGTGRKRLVRLTFDRPGVSGSFVTADGFATFDYLDPVVAYTSADAASNPDTASFPSLTNTTVSTLTGGRANRIIYVYGSNLSRRRSAGTPQDNFGDSIIRDVMVRNKTGVNGTGWADEWTGWQPISQRRLAGQANVWWDWTDDWVIFFTNLQQSEGRLRITARDIDAPFGNGTVQPNSIIQWSNIFDFSISKPTIDSLDGIPAGGFSTSGGDVLTINVPWSTLAGGATKFEVEIGSPTIYGTCGVLNRASDGNKPSFPPGSLLADRDSIVTGPAVSPHLVNSCRDQFAQNPRAEDLCKFYCRLPPTRGGSWVPVLLNVDDSRSNARHIWYKLPEISKVTVIDQWTGLPAGPVQVEYNLLATPAVVVSAPTTNATLIIEGTDFGNCPIIVIGTEEQLFHRRSTCELSQNGGDYRVPAGDRTHTRIVVPVPPGQGSRYPNGSWVFKLIVRAGGPDDFQDNVQPSGDNVTFAYQAPVIQAISPTTASTRGEGSTMVVGAAGTLLTIRGRNFGEPIEIGTAAENEAIVRFTLSPGAATDAQAILCANVTRVDHFTITCNVPEGSGGGLTVQLQTLDRRGNSATPALFSYERPRIDNVVMQVWDPTLYDNWPASWANRSNANATTITYTSVTGATGPTAGRYLVRINGRNFGPRVNNSNCVMVPFNTALGTIDCSNFLNVNQPLCKCPGKIRAGDLSDSDCNATTWFDLMGRPSTHVCDGFEGRRGEGEVFHDGGAMVAAMRENNPDLDVVVSILQGMDTFGAGFVVSWSHEMIEFLMPPGMGDHILTVAARNQYPPMSQEIVFSYARPEITGFRSLSGAISTGPANNDILEISGRNLGFSWPRVPPADMPRQGGRPGMGGTFDLPPWNAVGMQDADIASINAFYARYNRGTWPGRRSLAGIRELDYFPGATVTVKQWLYCLSTVTTAAVLTSPAIGCQVSRNNKNHTRFNILMHTHNRIVFRSHPGVGVNRPLEVLVHNTAALPAIMARANTTFSYDMPMPFQVDPQRLEVPRNTWIDVTGFNFGDRNDEPFFQFATPEEDALMRQVRVILDDIPFIGERSENSTVAFSSAMGKLETNLASAINLLRVGRKDMYVQVAGQNGTMLANATRGRPLHIVCNSGYFGRLGESCLICPPGSTCVGYVNDLDYERNMTTYEEANLPYVYPKPMFMFYNMNASDRLTAGMAAECPRAARNPVAFKNEFGSDIPYSALQSIPPYSQRDVCIVGCVPPEACGGDNYCTDGYMSKPPYFRCGSCAAGYYRRNLECVKCPDSPWLLVIGFILLAISFCGIGFFLNKKNVNIAFLSIAVDYAQVVSMFANARIAWPPEIKELLHILSAFNLNIEIIAPECIRPDITYTQKWGAIMALPISAGVIFLFVFACLYMWKRCVKGQKGRAILLSHQDSLIAMFLILFYFMYLYITRTLLEVFNCVPTNPDDGQLYMAAVFEPCGKPGGTQLWLAQFAVPGLLFYTAGYPLFCAWLLYKYQFEIMLDQLLRARATGDSAMTNPQAHWMRIRFSRLYYQYKPDYFAWMLVIIARKFLIAFTALMFRKDGAFQLAVALLVLFAAYALQVKFEPFMSPADRSEVLREHDRSRYEGTIHTRLAEALKDAAKNERKKTQKLDWNAPKAVLGRQILNRAGLFLFNYNTVESLLLGIAIMVCLAGIMFESLAGRQDFSVRADAVVNVATRQCPAFYREYCAGTMWGVIMLIAFSIVYLIVVVTVEVNGAFQEANLARANTVKRAKMAKKLGLDGGAASAKNILTKSVANVTKELDNGRDDVEMSHDFSSRIGVLETAVNPLFANAKNGAVPGTPGADVDEQGMLNAASIADMQDPPNPALWHVMRDTYKQLIDQSLKQREQLTQLKRQLADYESRMDAEKAREEELAAAYGMPVNKQSSAGGRGLDSALEGGSSGLNRSRSGRNLGATAAAPASRPKLGGAGAGAGKKAFGPAAASDY